MHIGEVAERTEPSLRSLRYWDHVGPISPTGRTDGGFRLYTEQDVRNILLVRWMKPLGFTLEAMSEVMRDIETTSSTASDQSEKNAAYERLAAVAHDADERRARLVRQVAMADEFIATLNDRLLKLPLSSRRPAAQIPAAASGAAVHVLYRYSDSAGRKARPEYFAKELALRSFIQALGPVRDDVAVTFLVDGAVRPEVASLMARTGAICPGRWHRQPPLLPRAVAHGGRARGGGDLVRRGRLPVRPRGPGKTLVAAVRAFPAVNWFALSGPTPLHRLELRRAQSAVPLPHSTRWTPATVPTVTAAGEQHLQRIDNTTGTFGGRPPSIRRALWVLRLCPWSGAAWDRTTCLALQGATPYPWRFLLTDLAPPSTPQRLRSLRVAWRVVTRVAVNVAALTKDLAVRC